MSTDDEELDQESDEGFWGQLDGAPEAAEWAGDELEEAYLRAMEVLEASDAQFPDAPQVDLSIDEATHVAETTPPSGTGAEQEQPQDGTATAASAVSSSSADRIDDAALAVELKDLSEKAAGAEPSSISPNPNVTPRQILEALMFVGGEPLTARKLVNVLRGEFSVAFVESEIDELNVRYAREGRPYEIRLGEGGYRMVLREDFERIRRKAYGLGPKEVKLTQEAIEVLAVIAYHQPVTTATIEELGKPGASGVIRQLIRRELVAVERTKGSKEITYRTTPRFLSLFGLRNLNELPRLEQVGYK
ncbi:MAG: SMC-Scp complex subunit ScpB [Planctomycetaceae bacterium]